MHWRHVDTRKTYSLTRLGIFGHGLRYLWLLDPWRLFCFLSTTLHSIRKAIYGSRVSQKVKGSVRALGPPSSFLYPIWKQRYYRAITRNLWISIFTCLAVNIVKDVTCTGVLWLARSRCSSAHGCRGSFASCWRAALPSNISHTAHWCTWWWAPSWGDAIREKWRLFQDNKRTVVFFVYETQTWSNFSHQFSLLIWSPKPGVSITVSFIFTPFSSMTEKQSRKRSKFWKNSPNFAVLGREF